jgi:hypothetical protein
MPNNYVLLERIELNASAASLAFTNIPQTGYTDLKVDFSVRNDNTTLNSYPSMLIKINTSTANLTSRFLYGDGASAASSTSTSGYVASINNNNTTSSTANTFTSGSIYFPNYTSSTNKSWSVDSVNETNNTSAYAALTAGLWSQTAAINAIEI